MQKIDKNFETCPKTVTTLYLINYELTFWHYLAWGQMTLRKYIKRYFFRFYITAVHYLRNENPHLLIYTYYSRLLAYREVADYGSNGPLQAHISNVRVFHFFAKLFFFYFWTQNLIFDICYIIISSMEYIPS